MELSFFSESQDGVLQLPLVYSAAVSTPPKQRAALLNVFIIHFPPDCRGSKERGKDRVILESLAYSRI